MNLGQLNMRICMGLTNSQYDPISLATPITIQLKFNAKKMFRAKLGWDNSLPEELQEDWRKMLVLLVEVVGDLEFERSTKPKDAIGLPEIAFFWDVSDEAFACTLYVRWKRENGEFSVKLLASITQL